MEITSDTILGYGLMNKISTGHSGVDMLLCLLVPLLVRNLLPWITTWVSQLFAPRSTVEQGFQRHVEHTKGNSYWWYEDNGPSNSILQRAILNYINKNVELLGELPTVSYQLKKKPAEVKQRGVASTEDDESQEQEQETEHDYDVNYVPPIGHWVDLKNGIKFMREQEEIEDKNSKNQKITYYLESKEKNGNKKIEAFVAEALALYKEQQAAKIDLARYLYIPVLTGWGAKKPSEEGGGSSPAAIYKRYKLSEEKSFASFFHPDKDSILSLVDQFLNKQGKFGIAGYPQKLGFLLYGPPGTGKTSFIKALGQYTKRSVISIPLTKIHTNQELMDIMFDQKIALEGDDAGISLPYSKTIFVMEDVDAASAVVQRRSNAVSTVELVSSSAAMDAAKAASLASSRKAKKGKKDSQSEIEPADDDSKSSGDEAAASSTKKKGFGPLPAFGRSFLADDELNLAGLLNVLDGVVDTPNRIVIMTTNHPEKLDPALIRPGRINKKIYMGRICASEALQMMKHYFGAGAITADVQKRLEQIFIDEALSPAELETMCADHETPDEMVEQLAAKFGGCYVASGTPYVKVF